MLTTTLPSTRQCVAQSSGAAATILVAATNHFSLWPGRAGQLTAINQVHCISVYFVG